MGNKLEKVESELNTNSIGAEGYEITRFGLRSCGGEPTLRRPLKVGGPGGGHAGRNTRATHPLNVAICKQVAGPPGVETVGRLKLP